MIEIANFISLYIGIPISIGLFITVFPILIMALYSKNVLKVLRQMLPETFVYYDHTFCFLFSIMLVLACMAIPVLLPWIIIFIIPIFVIIVPTGYFIHIGLKKLASTIDTLEIKRK